MGCGASGQVSARVHMPMKPPEIHPDAPVQEILEIMRCYPQLAGLQEEACFSLGSRAVQNEEFVRKFVAERGFECILSAMRNHAIQPCLQGQACGAIYNLALNNTVRAQLTSAGGACDILSAIRNFSGMTAVQHRCLAALSHLAMEPAAAKQVAEEGGIGDVLGAMRVNLGHAGLQEAACFAICSLSSHRESTVGAEIAEQGGIRDIIAAIQTHQQDTPGPQIGVQVKASLALYNLASNEATAAKISAEGGLEALLGSMRKYRKQLQLQEAGCAALQNLLCRSTERRARLAELGGVGTIVGAMEEHMGGVMVQVHGAQALQQMADGSAVEGDAYDLGGQGALRALAAALRAHPEEVAVQRAACGALANLLCSPRNRELLQAEGGLLLLRHALHRHAEEPSIVLFASAALANAADSAPGHAAVVEMGGVAAVVGALRRHGGDSRVQHMCCRALSQLAAHHHAHALMVAEGTVTEVLAAMRRHQEDAAVQEQACCVLGNLSSANPSIAQTIKAEGGAEAVTKAMETAGATENCKVWAQKVIESFAEACEQLRGDSENPKADV